MTPTLDWKGIDGWFDYHEVWDEFLNRMDRPSQVVEVGCFLGKSLVYLASEYRRRQIPHPLQILAVDVWAKVPEEPDINGYVERHNGNLLPRFLDNMKKAGVADLIMPIKKPSVEAATRFLDHSLDFVFIDADHRYECVKADIAAWLPKVRSGGGIGGHDIDRDGVHRAVKEQFGDKFSSSNRHWSIWLPTET